MQIFSPDPSRMWYNLGSEGKVVKMKYSLVVLLLFVMAAPAHASGYSITLTDPTGDDYGPGTYIYPLDPVFAPGCFDITRLTVREVGRNLHFEVEIAGEITDPWGSGAGFSLQSIDIYIDKDGISGSGSTASLERRNLTFSASSAWEYVIWCAPPFDGFQTHVIDSQGNTYHDGITVSADESSDVITINVPEAIIGTPTSSWHYICLMLSQNGYELGRVRPVLKNVGQWVLGGGDDSQYDSNVIDMVAEAGVNQEALLANYDPETRVQPILINRVDASSPDIDHSPPSGWEAHQPLIVTAEISDDVVTSVTLFYRMPNETYDSTDFVRTSATHWEAKVAGSEVVEPALEYYIFATDATNPATLPDSSNPFSIPVAPDTTPPLIEGFEVDPAIFSPNGDNYKDFTSVTLKVSEPSHLSVTVRDSSGAFVRSLAESTFAESTLTVTWDGRDSSSQVVGNGTYWIVARAEDLAFHPGQAESSTVEIDLNQPARQIDVILLFHANQNLVPYGRAANLACYKGVLTTLRAHPSLRFVIHFSGSLLSDLLWFDPETIDILRQGIADGQFEIVGSTYIQNIIYSTRLSPDDFQFNQHQIALHKSLIEHVLGRSPVSFWNPERVWTQNIVKLLTDNGYTTVQVEDHILWDSGISGSEYAVRTTTYNGKSVYVFTDDKIFEGMINGAIDSGDTSSVLGFLHHLYLEDVDDLYAVCYHEDMEATGLWDYENGEDPAIDLANLDKLLTAFENNPWIRVTTYSEFLQNHHIYEEVTPIVDGAADWMGRDAWFDENSEPEAQAYRQFFDTIRDTINAIHATFPSYAPDTLSARHLIDYAWFTLCAHQYEFAVHGYQGIVGTTQWDLARCALVSARAAREALQGVPHSFVGDINSDGIDEIVIVTDGDMFVFSPYGGRLLYWFDLEEGTQDVGNENFMTSYGETYTDDARYVEPTIGCQAYSWLCGNMIFPEIHTWRFEARRRCLNDSIWIDGSPQGDLADTELTYSLDSTSVEFYYSLGPIDVTKHISTSLHNIAVEYVFESSASSLTTIEIGVENGLSPDCLNVLFNGRQSLKYWDGTDTSSVFYPSMRGAVNVVSGKGLLFEFMTQPDKITAEDNVFGLEISPYWTLDVPPFGNSSLTVALSIGSFSGLKPPPREHGNLIIKPNPFNRYVMILYNGQKHTPTHLRIYDTMGRLVRVLDGKKASAGYLFTWNGHDSFGRQVANGVYFVRIVPSRTPVEAKVILAR